VPPSLSLPLACRQRTRAIARYYCSSAQATLSLPFSLFSPPLACRQRMTGSPVAGARSGAAAAAAAFLREDGGAAWYDVIMS